MHVALSLHTPIVIKGDLENWDVESVIRKAMFKITGVPYDSP